MILFFRDENQSLSYLYIINNATWNGVGNDEQCKNPKLFWELIVAPFESLVSFVAFQYYDRFEEEIFWPKEMKKIFSVDDSVSGRCYRVTPTLDMMRRGIRKIRIGFLSLSLVYIHTPGLFKDASRTVVGNEMGKRIFYLVEPEFYLRKNEEKAPCNEDPASDKSNCIDKALQKFLIERYGCTTPFGPDKDNICTNKTIGKQAMSTYRDWFGWIGQEKVNCFKPCQMILIKAMLISKMEQQSSELIFKFPIEVKEVKNYSLYSGLSLFAEIGGYFGLFLGVSLNQITRVTSYLLGLIEEYYI